jgi:hypothetical protein
MVNSQWSIDFGFWILDFGFWIDPDHKGTGLEDLRLWIYPTQGLTDSGLLTFVLFHLQVRWNMY